MVVLVAVADSAVGWCHSLVAEANYAVAAHCRFALDIDSLASQQKHCAAMEASSAELEKAAKAAQVDRAHSVRKGANIVAAAQTEADRPRAPPQHYRSSGQVVVGHL